MDLDGTQKTFLGFCVLLTVLLMTLAFLNNRHSREQDKLLADSADPIGLSCALWIGSQSNATFCTQYMDKK